MSNAPPFLSPFFLIVSGQIGGERLAVGGFSSALWRFPQFVRHTALYLFACLFVWPPFHRVHVRCFPSRCFTSCQTLPLIFLLLFFFNVFFSDQTVKRRQKEMNAIIKIPPRTSPPCTSATHHSISRGSAPPVTPAEQVSDGTISNKKQQRPVYLSTLLPADTSRAATLSAIKLSDNIILNITICCHYCHYYDDFFLLFLPFLTRQIQ